MRISTFIVTTAVAAALAVPALAQPPGGGGGAGRPGMSPEERAAAFKAADKNADGKLDKAEFIASLPDQVRDQFGEQAFTGRDANTDGSISLEEFSTGGRGGGRGPGGGGGRPGG